MRVYMVHEAGRGEHFHVPFAATANPHILAMYITPRRHQQRTE